MALDFTVLDALPKVTAQKALEEDFKTIDEEEPTEALEGLEMAFTGLTEGTATEEEVEDPVEGLKVVALGDIKKSRELQEGIVRGIREGVPEYTLLLQAVEAVALLTGEDSYYKQIREDLIAIHGDGLQNQLPLEWQLEDIKTGLRKMKASLKRKTLKPETRQRIEEAVKVYEARGKEVAEAIADASQLTFRDITRP